MSDKKPILIGLGGIIVLLILYFGIPIIADTPDLPDTIERVVDMPTKINDGNGVNIEVTPVDFSLDRPVKFDVTITTHEGALDFDMKEISTLEDYEGNEYLPLSWEGSPPGGHHRSGILTFPVLEGETKQIKLTIENVYDVPERVFIWSL